MKTRILYSLALFSVAPLAVMSQVSKISTPAARQTTLKTVSNLLGEMPAPVADAEVQKDPFYPPGQDLQEDYDPNAAAPTTLRRSDADLLEAIVAQIQPSGSGTYPGGEPYLVFGEKRRKKGDKVMVMIDKVEYEAEISIIDKNRFRIRYNNVESRFLSTN